MNNFINRQIMANWLAKLAADNTAKYFVVHKDWRGRTKAVTVVNPNDPTEKITIQLPTVSASGVRLEGLNLEDIEKAKRRAQLSKTPIIGPIYGKLMEETSLGIPRAVPVLGALGLLGWDLLIRDKKKLENAGFLDKYWPLIAAAGLGGLGLFG